MTVNIDLVSSEFLEREKKYYAADGSLAAFLELGRVHSGEYVIGSGLDVYWEHPDFPLPTIRHRYNESRGELTVKTKVGGSNTIRNEANLLLKGPSLREVERLLELQGYRRALQIGKTSHIFYLPEVVLSWYAVTDIAGTLMTTPKDRPARFVEIELREDIDWGKVAKKYHNLLERDTNTALVDHFCREKLYSWTKELGKAGILEYGSIKESLWEMFGEHNSPAIIT